MIVLLFHDCSNVVNSDELPYFDKMIYFFFQIKKGCPSQKHPPQQMERIIQKIRHHCREIAGAEQTECQYLMCQYCGEDKELLSLYYYVLEMSKEGSYY